jgi:hypothetical protein
MLNRENQCLDLQKGRLAEQPVDINAKRMRSEFGVDANAQAPKGMCMIEFKIEMDVVLYVHGGICLIRTGT